MIDITKHRFSQYFLFGSLYFTEGLNKVFAVVVLPIYFLEKGVPPEMVTLVIGIAAIPMIIKIVCGGTVDYFIKFGRRFFIILGGVLTILSLFLLAFIDPGIALIPFTVVLFICWSGVGFLDVSSDALAIEISEEYERGKINGSMYAGQNIGMAFGAIFLPFIGKIFGYPIVFISAGLIVLLIILFPLLVKETKRIKKQEKMGSLLLSEFKKKLSIQVAVFAVLVTISSGMLLFLATLYMNINLQIDITLIGSITMIFTLAMAAGSIIGGTLADKLGRKSALYILIWASIIFTALLIFTNTWENFVILYGIVGFLQGGYHAAFLAMYMDVTNPKVGATQFSIFTGLGNLGAIGAGAISGTLFVMLGINRVFLYSAWAFGPAILILHFIRLKKQIRTA